MVRRFALVLLCVAATFAVAPSTAHAASRVSIGAGVHASPSLDATVFAKRLRHVAALAEDDAGRIWAATTAADGDGDAVYVIARHGATPRKVIDDVDTPLGLLWVDGTLFVSRTGGIDRYSGFDGTAFTEHGSVLDLGDVGLVQGLALAPDGRIVVGVAAPCDACVPASPWAAAVVSVRPDGSDARAVASGIRSAVGLAYVPGTDDLLVTMNQRDDLGDDTPGDWLAHVEDGQSWGFPDCYGQATAECSAFPEPIGVLADHAALSGVAVVDGTLGEQVGTGAVVAEWATGRVAVVSLTAAGDSYTGTVRTLLTGLEHPVPVLVTRAGTLLVGDWGTGRILEVSARS